VPKFKSLLKTIDVESAERQRTCKFSGAKIPMGESCIVVFDSPRERFCYSRAVALQMIELARSRLDELAHELKTD